MLGAGSDDGGMEARSPVEDKSGFSAEREAGGGMSWVNMGACLLGSRNSIWDGGSIPPQ